MGAKDRADGQISVAGLPETGGISEIGLGQWPSRVGSIKMFVRSWGVVIVSPVYNESYSFDQDPR